jgi:hypothetical protein
VGGLGGGERNLIYGDDDYAGCTVATVNADLTAYLAEIERADRAIAALPFLEAPGACGSQSRAVALCDANRRVHQLHLVRSKERQQVV